MVLIRNVYPILPWASCLAVLMLAASSVLAAEPVKVFLLGGQSNMYGRGSSSGLPATLRTPQSDVLFYYGSLLTTLRPGSGGDFGPEITFGRTVADGFPAQRFALIKYAVGGTNLYDHWNPASGSTYATFRGTVTAGMAALAGAGYDPQIIGMLWTQGERDAKTGRTGAQYEADLNEFIGDIRTRYGSDLPFFLTRLASGQTNIPAAGLDHIRTAQADVVAADPNAYIIDADGMGLMSDNLHFDAAGQVEMGDAFGQAYVNSVPEPGTLGMLALGTLAAARRRRRS